MSTSAPEKTESGSDFERMGKTQKLAALLVLLGPESAAQVLKGLDEQEIETITGEMAAIGMLSRETQAQVLNEFAEVAVAASTSVRGGAELTQVALEKALGTFKASKIMSRIAPTQTPVAAIQEIAEVDAHQLFNLLKNEPAQMIALILSYLSPEKGSQVMSLLSPEKHEEVIERLAQLAPTPVEVVEGVITLLKQKLGGKYTRALRQSGGVKSAADILNALDKNVSKGLLLSLEEKNPSLGQSIRQKMFTFEDLSRLDPAALQKVLREVDMRDLAVALKNASKAVTTCLLGCLSKRAAETVNEEIGFLGQVKPRDIEAAQMRIIDVVRRLETEGEVEAAGAKGNEVHA